MPLEEKQAELALSIIIPFHNEVAALGTQLAAFLREPWSEPWELILVDNQSTDGSAAVVQHYVGQLPNARYLWAATGRGPAYARNVGVQEARGRALAFCDADDEIGAGWLSAMGKALQEHACVASRYETERLNAPWVRHAFGPHAQEQGLQRLPFPPQSLHASGAGLGVLRRVHEEVGGFNEAWRCLEDTDYCLRIQQLGIPLFFAPDAVMHYRYRDTLPEIFWQSYAWAWWNVVLYKTYGGHRHQDWWRWRQHGHLWRTLVRDALTTRDRGSLADVTRRLGGQLGRLMAALRYRVPPAC